MHRKLIAAAAATCLTLGLGATAASAAPPKGVGKGGVPAGIQCQQAGIGTLKELGLLSTVARDGIEVVGLGNVAFRDVLAFHRSSPEVFQTGGVSVVVPGVEDPVPATWCNGIG